MNAGDLASELEGLAEGAKISLDDAVLLQIRSELIYGGSHVPVDPAECTTVGLFVDAQRPVSAQTVDLPGQMAELAHVFRILPEQPDHPEILMYSLNVLRRIPRASSRCFLIADGVRWNRLRTSTQVQYKPNVVP